MFKMFFQMIFIFVLMMSFSACSDDGDDSSGTGSSVGSSSSEVATLANSTGSIAENAADGDTVGNLTISSTGDTAITAITLSGTGSGDFQVSTGGEITVATGAAIDYEVIPVYNLTAVATNTVGNSASVDVTISVSDFENLFQTAIIRADDAQVEDAFGKATAVSGNYMVVGVQYEDTGGQTTGSAYVFKKQSDGSLMQIAKIQANDAAANDNFGESVTINGDYIVVGAPREDTTGSDAGSVYLFRRNSDSTDDVTQIAKFQADDAASGTYFGNSVAMVGDYVVVGAEQANSSGSAYLFKRNSDTTDDVTQLAKIQPSDGEATDYFGSSVAVSGNYIIVGAYAEDTNGSMAGSAYLFKRNSDATDDVTQLAKIQPNDVEAGDYFGYSVAISGDYVVVGAYLEDTSGSNAGSVYLFKRNSDTTDDVVQLAKIQASDPEASDGFGLSVAISRDIIVVGAQAEDTSGDSAGSVYLFKRNSDTTDDVVQLAKIQANDIEAGDRFGTAVAISNEIIIVGADGQDTIAMGASVVNAGSAYIFDMESIEKTYIYNAPASTISYDEPISNTAVYSFEAASSSGGTISYTLGGTDSDSFSFTDNILSFAATADFESPVDGDSSNDYNITVIATDINSNATTTAVNIVVNDKYYPSFGQIQSADIEEVDYFGNSVAVSGDYVLASARSEDTTASGAGSAYLFKKQANGTLSQLAKFQANDAELYDYFGNSVAMDGDIIVVGTQMEDTSGDSAGSVYLFKRNSDATDDVTQLAKIQANDIEAGDRFGYLVAINGDIIAVGAPYEDTTASDAGSVYLFKRDPSTDAISQIAKIQASDAQTDDHFGLAVAINGDIIVVGATGEDTGGLTAGSAYVYKRDPSTDIVTEIAKIQGNDTDSWDYFGGSVAVSGDIIVAGANEEDSAGSYAGSAYVFKRDPNTDIVTQIAKIQADDIGAYYRFGGQIAMSGDIIVVGAYGKNSGAGGAYVFKRDSNTDEVTQIDSIQPSDGEANDGFGSSVSISGDIIAIGAQYEDTTASNAGIVQVFEKDSNQP